MTNGDIPGLQHAEIPAAAAVVGYLAGEIGCAPAAGEFSIAASVGDIAIDAGSRPPLMPPLAGSAVAEIVAAAVGVVVLIVSCECDDCDE